MTAPRRRVGSEERANPVQPVHIWRPRDGAPTDMVIVTHLAAYATMHQHASVAMPNETGGFLVGRVACDEAGRCWHIEIEEAVPIEPSSQDPTHFSFTWRDVERVRSYREQHGKALVGWFHTHPDLGVFLSETDLECTHRPLFSEPFQVALVYDPVRGRAGYFIWDDVQQIDAGQADWREFDLSISRAPAYDQADLEPQLHDVLEAGNGSTTPSHQMPEGDPSNTSGSGES